VTKTRPCVLTIAGSDSSGGAGIQADIKTISATGCYAASAITALTSQNTLGVQAIYPVPPSTVSEQIESVLSDLNVNAVKIGMLFNQHIMEAVADALKKFKPHSIVLDPVMLSKNKCELLQKEAILYLYKNLFPLCTLITPNISEAEKLLGEKIKTQAAMEGAAAIMGKRYGTNILIKGGHLKTKLSSDVLYSHKNEPCYWYKLRRINTTNNHGTGCTLSSAIASYLAQDYSLHDAILMAKHYLTKTLESGKHLKIGHGIGPVDHFYWQTTPPSFL
jgi:hydroxymethylpyrimidine/phosphomethylpyrimidine kinase